ncbi:hypothetical protein LTR56_026522 [Elasticomyces elasticus]|nr:hypothetical protein LTR56_026522 [Elasticomyces elasticus]
MKLISTSSALELFLAAITFSAFARSESNDQPILSLSQDESFHFELLVPLGEAIYGGADVAPVLGAAENITVGNFSSFHEVFYTLAKATKAQAEDPANAYDPLNVRETWFATATYFRRADFYLHGDWDNPLINSLWDEQLNAFDHAISALPNPGKRLQIPADTFAVEAIWYPATNESSKRPTLIMCNGYDGAQEDLFHTLVVPALARGWNALTFEGPGHPTVRRRQNLGFIPDWERVVTPVVDYLLAQQADNVDADRLALFGYSFGGYLAARAAAFEPRLSAVLLDGGIWDTYQAYIQYLPATAIALLDSGDKLAFDKALFAAVQAPETSSQVRWGLDQGLWSFKTHSPYDFFQMTKAYAVKDFVHDIAIPVWIADGVYEGFFQGQSAQVKDALGPNATLHVFTGPAGYHCQSSNEIRASIDAAYWN